MRVATADGLGSAHRARSPASERRASSAQTALDGAVPPYSIPNVRDRSDRVPSCRSHAGYMRGSPQREFAFFTESFIDELARAAGIEPLAFRMSMLGGNRRLARCLQAAARLAQWDGGGPGSTMGIAGCSAFGSHIGAGRDREHRRRPADQGAPAGRGGRLRPRRQSAASSRQQIEGGLIWALAQATVAAPEWVAGMPRARPLGGLGLPRIGDTPRDRGRDHPEQRRRRAASAGSARRRSRRPSPTRSTPAPASACARCRSTRWRRA